MTDNVNTHAIISGKVQGVCFRIETRRAAEGLGVNGWVRNRKDGTVEAVFEGTKTAVEAILEWCRQGPPMSRVLNLDITWNAATGGFDAFDIR